MQFSLCIPHHAIIGCALTGVIALLPLTNRAAGELPPPIPNDPSVNEQACRQEIARQRLAAQDQNDLYHCKVDFARLEHEHPLTREELKKITPADLKAREATQERVDQIYARLTAGPIPDGFYKISVFRSEGGVRFEDYKNIAGPKGVGLALLLKQSWLRQIFEILWQGKVFERDKKIVRTKVLFGSALSGPMGQLFGSQVTPNSTKFLFPAKVYCGQSLLDGRRESIILDYGFSSDIPGYRPRIDTLMGPDKLQVRDEIRMVRPGLYLGRIYIGRIFVFNFTLDNPDIADKPADEASWSREDCNIGLQRQARRSIAGPS